MITIKHNLGLGDHMICMGIVTNYLSNHLTAKLVCKPHNYESVSFMYKNYRVEFVMPGNEKGSVMDLTMRRFEKAFDKSFYEKAGVGFDERWSGFNITRDHDREFMLYKYLNLKKPYRFIHEDPARKMIIPDRYKVNPYLPNRSITNCIFDYCMVIEEAEEAHCIESSFAFMIDSLNLNPNTYVHRNSRKLSEIEIPIYKYVNVI